MSLVKLIKEKIDKTKTWVDTSTNVIYSRDIKGYKNFIQAIGVNEETNKEEYYIIFTNGWFGTPIEVDDYGRNKIKLDNSKFISYLKNVNKGERYNLTLSYCHTDDTGLIYKIDI